MVPDRLPRRWHRDEQKPHRDRRATRRFLRAGALLSRIQPNQSGVRPRWRLEKRDHLVTQQGIVDRVDRVPCLRFAHEEQKRPADAGLDSRHIGSQLFSTMQFAEGLPPALVDIGGANDTAFIGDTAYMLVSLVGFRFSSAIDGIYRLGGTNAFTVVADLGGYSFANPPSTPFDLPNGVQYAIGTYCGGFLVTDGHQDRVLRVMLASLINRQRISFLHGPGPLHVPPFDGDPAVG